MLELKLLDDKLDENNKIYTQNKKTFFFNNKICLSCWGSLSTNDIDCRNIYCQDCCDTDSCLDFKNHLH